MTVAPTESVIRLSLTIERDDVLQFLGYPTGQKPVDRVGALMDEVIEEARTRANARGSFVKLDVARVSWLGLESIDASGLVVGLVTIGDRIERRASELLAAGETTRALLLDAAGSAAVEEAADRLGAIIAGDDGQAPILQDRIAHVSCRISPGYGRWPISAQQRLFAVLPHAGLGVLLLPSMMMVPRKSISFAMWLGADARPISGLSGCSRCELERCRYRKDGEAQGA